MEKPLNKAQKKPFKTEIAFSFEGLTILFSKEFNRLER